MKKSSSFLRKPKTLYVADNVGHSVSLRGVEMQQNLRIKSARAYSSVYDTRAKLSSKNFANVVTDSLKNPGSEEIDVLVMSAPTVDITNLDTNIELTATNKNNLENQVKLSSQNMFSLAERSLKNHPNLKKVILMEQPPKFDFPDADPHSVKPNLAKLAIIMLGQYWLNSSLKDRIIIGRHTLDSPGSGATHYRRYQNYQTGRYDGVHLYGRSGCTDYTNSVNTILSLALHSQNQNAAIEQNNIITDDHSNCPQAVYQRDRYHASVQVSNRFDVLKQGNY